MCPRHPRVLGPRVPVPGLPRAEQVGKGPGARGPCPGRAESQASGGAWALGPNPQGTTLVCCQQDRSRPEDDLVSGRDRLTCPCAFPARDKHDAVCRQTVCVQQGRSQANTHAPWGEAGKGGTRGGQGEGLTRGVLSAQKGSEVGCAFCRSPVHRLLGPAHPTRCGHGQTPSATLASVRGAPALLVGRGGGGVACHGE